MKDQAKQCSETVQRKASAGTKESSAGRTVHVVGSIKRPKTSALPKGLSDVRRVLHTLVVEASGRVINFSP